MGALALLSMFAQPLFAQSYPTHPVKILVQFPPGGVPDLCGRLMAEYLTKELQQPFIVENRPGAGGNLATDLAAKSTPDGYTLLLSASSPLAISPAIFNHLPFDATRDFKPISLIASFNFVMMASPAFPQKSIAEIVEFAKARPGKLNFASSGYGSEHHLSGELFNHAAGINLVHVPYKGFGPATLDTMANNIELMFGSVPASLPFIKGGKLRAIATTGPVRDGNLPDVPTFTEAGYPQIKVVSWVGFVAPAGIPDAVYDMLVKASTKVLQSPEFVQRLKNVGLIPMPVGPKPMAERISEDQAFWTKVVHDSNIKKAD
ncbi:MAG: tripartite tricarboxylate transporter substrate binding protein [Burkholderiales bacterium]|nr:tripartite tricarboxylate transporter substrate binding protein [Burkholderiales bacterium]